MAQETLQTNHIADGGMETRYHVGCSDSFHDSDKLYQFSRSVLLHIVHPKCEEQLKTKPFAPDKKTPAATQPWL